jgi:hypothetical protein
MHHVCVRMCVCVCVCVCVCHVCVSVCVSSERAAPGFMLAAWVGLVAGCELSSFSCFGTVCKVSKFAVSLRIYSDFWLLHGLQD